MSNPLNPTTRLVVISNGDATSPLVWSASDVGTSITLRKRNYADYNQVWILKNDGTNIEKNTIVNVGKGQKVLAVTCKGVTLLYLDEYNPVDPNSVQQFIITTSKPGGPSFIKPALVAAQTKYLISSKQGTDPDPVVALGDNKVEWSILPIIN